MNEGGADAGAAVAARPGVRGFVARYFRSLGPGLTTGAADDDPSGIGTYSQQGAQFGFQLLWLSVFTFPFMAIVQEMCARIGIVTGQGLAANIGDRYPRGILFTLCGLLLVANTLNMAADLGAMAAALRLLVPGLHPIAGVVAFAALSVGLQIVLSYQRYARVLKYLTLVLFSYVVTAFVIPIDWSHALAHAFVPTITVSRDQIMLICAVFGTAISPYLFFWQTSQEVEEHRLARGEDHLASAHRGCAQDTTEMRADIRRMRVDVWSGMFFANVVMFFIVLTCAATLNANGLTDIATAEQAAAAIRPLGGTLAYVLFAFGIIGTGLLALPVLAGSSAYAVAESLDRKAGLHFKLREAGAFYAVIVVSMIIAVIATTAGLDPIRGLVISAMVNGMIAPVVLFFVVRISSSMVAFGNHRLTTIGGWLITGIMAVAGAGALVALFL